MPLHECIRERCTACYQTGEMRASAHSFFGRTSAKNVVAESRIWPANSVERGPVPEEPSLYDRSEDHVGNATVDLACDLSTCWAERNSGPS